MATLASNFVNAQLDSHAAPESHQDGKGHNPIEKQNNNFCGHSNENEKSWQSTTIKVFGPGLLHFNYWF